MGKTKGKVPIPKKPTSKAAVNGPISGGKRCYQTHPPYLIADGITVYGGSCKSPMVSDADIYVGFDKGYMTFTDRQYPWVEGHEFLYPIIDRSVPQDLETFNTMVEWIAKEITEGKMLHAGCIGGHGRTGTFFAVLRYVLTGDKDAGSHVRENYCGKTIESVQQVNFLHEKYGIKKIEPRDGYGTPHGGGGGGKNYSLFDKGPKTWSGSGKPKSEGKGTITYDALEGSALSIW